MKKQKLIKRLRYCIKNSCYTGDKHVPDIDDDLYECSDLRKTPRSKTFMPLSSIVTLDHAWEEYYPIEHNDDNNECEESDIDDDEIITDADELAKSNVTTSSKPNHCQHDPKALPNDISLNGHLNHLVCYNCHRGPNDDEKLSIVHQDDSYNNKEQASALFDPMNEGCYFTEEIYETKINKHQSLLSHPFEQNDIIDTDLPRIDESWPGDRIFDEQLAPNCCIQRYDRYLANLISRTSGLPITGEQLPNISPRGINIDHLDSSERCSIPCIASKHVLSCLHSRTFFGSKSLTSTTMKPKSPEYKHFLIVGAGPAGLYMAIQCLLRGHDVSLVDKRTTYNRAIPCGLFETETKFFQLIGLPSCLFPCVKNYSKKVAMYIPDVEEIMLKISMKMGALVYLACQFDSMHQVILSYSRSKPGIRCSDGLSVDKEIPITYDVLVYATGNNKLIPLDLFELKSARLLSQIFEEVHSSWLAELLPSLFNRSTTRLHSQNRCRHSYPRQFPIISSSRCLHAIKQFLLDKSYEGGVMIASRLPECEKDLVHWLCTVKQQDIVRLSQSPLLGFVSHIPAYVFSSNQPQEQITKLPADWIFVPCFTSPEKMHNNELHTIQFEGPLPMEYRELGKAFPFHQFLIDLLQKYLNLSLNETEWHQWCRCDASFKKYSQSSTRVFPLRFKTLIQDKRLFIKQTDFGDITLDYDRSRSSMWGHFTDPIHRTRKEFFIIGDCLCTPYYRFGIGLHNATRATLAYFDPDPNDKLRKILDFEVSLVKQMILTLFSLCSSSGSNQADLDFFNLLPIMPKKIDKQTDLSVEKEDKLHLLLSTFTFQ